MNNYQQRQCRVSADPIRTPDSLKKVFKAGDETMLPHVNNTEKGIKSSRERRRWALPEHKHKLLTLVMAAMMVIYIQAVALALPPVADNDSYSTPVDTDLVVASR